MEVNGMTAVKQDALYQGDDSPGAIVSRADNGDMDNLAFWQAIFLRNILFGRKTRETG